MRRAGVLGILAAMALIGVPSAGAAVEVGNTCTVDIGHANATQIQLTKAPGETAPIAVPTDGVVTQWKATLPPTESMMAQRMKVFRATGTPNEFIAVTETSLELMVAGVNVFETRIPVKAGDRFGAYGPIETLTCTTGNPADSMGTFAGNAVVGSTNTFSPSSGERVAVAAVVEPDVDGDGYGDETQDKCPEKAALQTPCPTIALDAFPIVLKRSVLVLVSASAESSVEVFGQISRGKIIAPRSAQGSKRRPPKPVTQPKPSFLLLGGTQTVIPGQIARFNVRLPQAVIQRLKGLRPNRSLKATITAFTTDLAGRLGTRTITVRLKGQAPPAPSQP